MLCVVPFAHVYGMTAAMNVAITLGAEMIILPNFVTEQVLTTIRRYKPTLFPGVPTMYVAINNFPGVRRFGISSIQACLSGAAPLPVEVQETFEKLTHGRLVEGYGLTEAGPVTHANPMHGHRKNGTIGVPLPNTEARIVHLASGETLPPGEIGELAVRGPQIMSGYLGEGSETETKLRDGWLYTGDVARMDSEGYFQIISRKKDMWYHQHKGQNVPAFPRDVEEVIYEIPEVQEAAVVGVHNFPVAFVTTNRAIDAASIMNYVGRRLPDLTPKLVVFVDEMPKSFIGKVIRRHLLDKIPEPQRKALDIVSDHIDQMLDYPYPESSD
jgi:long-chain acyl-CoA synthetase